MKSLPCTTVSALDSAVAVAVVVAAIAAAVVAAVVVATIAATVAAVVAFLHEPDRYAKYHQHEYQCLPDGPVVDESHRQRHVFGEAEEYAARSSEHDRHNTRPQAFAPALVSAPTLLVVTAASLPIAPRSLTGFAPDEVSDENDKGNKCTEQSQDQVEQRPVGTAGR